MTTTLKLTAARLSALSVFAFALLLAGCAPLPPARPPSGHLSSSSVVEAAHPAAFAVPPRAVVAEPPAPPPVTLSATLSALHGNYSLAVQDIGVETLLHAIGRDAGIDLDLHPGLEGRVTLHAIEQPLHRLLERIARQAPIRFELGERHLTVRPDTPFLRSYTLDYANISRSMRGTVATSTQIATSSNGGQQAGPGNASVTQIETRASNDFWDSLQANVRAILDEAAVRRGHCGSNGNAKDCSHNDIMLNRESGVLMVRASARQHEHLAAFLDQVQESARRQVMIEATIVEVTLADAYRQGIDWNRLGLPGWSVQPRGASDSGGTGAPTLSYLSARHEVRLDLLETFGTVKVLSSPRLSVLNNQTAMLKVVEEFVYFLVDATTTEYADSEREKITATTTPQSVSVGMVMSVTPQISAGGEIILNVRPTISAIAGFRDDPNPSLRNIPNRVPQIRTREIESMLRLRSGEIAVLGGLMEDRIDHDNGRIPLLGEVPVLGELFTRRDNRVRRTELLIFLRPLLIADPSVRTDYASYAEHLPSPDFLLARPSPGQRNFPGVPLGPLLVPSATGAPQ